MYAIVKGGGGGGGARKRGRSTRPGSSFSKKSFSVVIRVLHIFNNYWTRLRKIS